MVPGGAARAARFERATRSAYCRVGGVPDKVWQGEGHCFAAETRPVLVLGPDQLDTIEQHMLKMLQTRLQRVIASTFPELNGGAAGESPAERLRTIVERGIETATKYGIEEPPDLAAFIALGLAWRALPRETSTDWIKSWLERPDTPGSTKLAVIEAQLAGTNGHPALSVLTQRVMQARREAAAP